MKSDTIELHFDQENGNLWMAFMEDFRIELLYVIIIMVN